jgi:glycosyltransferase involved in cell wall biosynthesis
VRKYGLEKSKIILSVGRLAASEKYKGQDKVIAAMPLILKEVPGAKYLIVGRGDDKARLKNLAVELGVEDKVVFAGFIPQKELADYYNLCDVFSMVSKREGFGIVFLEALSCGKIVIAGNKDASKEALLGGELGILVDPDNKEMVAGSIVSALRKKVPQKLLDRRYLRERVVRAYGSDQFERRLKELLERI